MSHPELKGDRCPKCNGSGCVVTKDGSGLPVSASCASCSGTGIVNSPNACPKCKGSGTVEVDTGMFIMENDCDECNGTGLKSK
ncbi:hypothetical protein KKG41_05755 [Patescibacteria group bacterium]|nr:hypothetical protein [Patescibacteria group bacterium]MBU1890692.1 hypothetical protein [Patescibacteria group bacterium]